jgi:hypothetical protein
MKKNLSMQNGVFKRERTWKELLHKQATLRL